MRGEKKRGGGIGRFLLIVQWKDGGSRAGAHVEGEERSGGLVRQPAPACGQRARVGGVHACSAVPSRGDDSLTRGPEATVTGGTV
jgi:hypothetical protein